MYIALARDHLSSFFLTLSRFVHFSIGSSQQYLFHPFYQQSFLNAYHMCLFVPIGHAHYASYMVIKIIIICVKGLSERMTLSKLIIKWPS